MLHYINVHYITLHYDVFIEHVGQPILACIREAVRALQDLDMHREVQLIVSGGVRNGADVAKCMHLAPMLYRLVARH